jgi:hypothetical protein
MDRRPSRKVACTRSLASQERGNTLSKFLYKTCNSKHASSTESQQVHSQRQQSDWQQVDSLASCASCASTSSCSLMVSLEFSSGHHMDCLRTPLRAPDSSQEIRHVLACFFNLALDFGFYGSASATKQSKTSKRSSNPLIQARLTCYLPRDQLLHKKPIHGC